MPLMNGHDVTEYVTAILLRKMPMFIATNAAAPPCCYYDDKKGAPASRYDTHCRLFRYDAAAAYATCAALFSPLFFSDMRYFADDAMPPMLIDADAADATPRRRFAATIFSCLLRYADCSYYATPLDTAAIR